LGRKRHQRKHLDFSNLNLLTEMLSVTGCPEILPVPDVGFSVQLRSNSGDWLHRTCPRKRHQMRHLLDLPCLLAKQVLSQLSYTPMLTV